MATIAINLPETMKRWAEARAQSGAYGSTSDYVVDLLRKDRKRMQKLARMQTLVGEGIESGFGSASMEDLRERATKPYRGD